MCGRSFGVQYTVYTAYTPAGPFEAKGASVYLPAAATDLRIVAGSADSLTFHWTPDPLADTFQVNPR